MPDRRGHPHVSTPMTPALLEPFPPFHPEVRLQPPPIGRWRRAAGTEVEFVHVLDSGRPGPSAMVVALTHGNELCGAIALDGLLREAFRPARGRLVLAFANVEAFGRFNPLEPFASRCVDEDMNRVWDDAVLCGSRDSVELRRARELAPFVDAADVLLDLHSMQEPGAPALTICGMTDKSVPLARALGQPETLLVDTGHAAGLRMIDRGGFADPASGRQAVLVECGAHWEPASADLAIDVTARFLRHFQPRICILMETEVWPNLMAQCVRHDVPVALVNARLSERSLRKGERLGTLMSDAARAMHCVGAQTEEDAARIRKLGAPEVAVTGSIKFDVVPPQAALDIGAMLRARFADRPVLLCASTREGEEALILDALAETVDDHPIDLPGTSMRDDLLALVQGMVGRSVHTGQGQLYAWMVAESERNPHIAHKYKSLVVERRRQLLSSVLRKWRERGELRPDVDIEIAELLVTAPMLVYRVHWNPGEEPPAGWGMTPIPVQVIVGDAPEPLSDEERLRRRKSALDRLRELRTYEKFGDPLEWQRNERKDRPLPGRD